MKSCDEFYPLSDKIAFACSEDLFDLSKDVGERKTKAEKFPQVVEELKKELEKWEAQIKQPMWPCREAPGEWVVDGVKLKICI